MSATGVSEMNGMFKEVYGPEGPVRAVPNAHHLARDIKFVPSDQREGAAYNIPVLLTREQGHSFSLDGSAFALNGAITDQSENARVQGAEHVLQVQLSYGALQKATAKGKRAFANATRYKIKAATEASSYMREYQLLYGSGATPATGTLLPDNMGEVSANTAGLLTLTAPSWSAGLWAGAIGMPVDCYDNTGALVNTTSALIVSGINHLTRQVTVTGADAAAPGAGDYLYPRGSYGKTMLGAVRIAATTAAGATVHGISTNYDLWRGNTYAVGGALTFQALQDALSHPVNKGFAGKMTVYVSTNQFNDLNDDQAALRNYTGGGGSPAGGKWSNGAEELSFFSQAGEIVIKPHIFMKQGYALALATTQCKRVGATDVTFKMPDHGEIFRHLDSQAGVEFRTYQNQSFFTAQPSHTLLLTGISSTGDA